MSDIGEAALEPKKEQENKRVSYVGGNTMGLLMKTGGNQHVVRSNKAYLFQQQKKTVVGSGEKSKEVRKGYFVKSTAQ